MGYIKKLKNNELVGGTDKHTIYPVTSTKAVFEEVSENNFQSQEYLNNHIYGGEGGRINEKSITDYNIATGTITKGKLTPQVQTMLDEGQKKALTPKGNYNPETEYEALDFVFDPVTNSSYISLQTPNVGHPVDENAEGYEEGWWEKTLDGTAVNTAQAAIDAKVGQLETQVGTAITQAETAVDEAKQETLNAYTQAEALAQQITDWSSSEISSIPSYTDQHPLSNRASSAQIGYFECGTSSATQASNQIKAVTAGGYALPTSGGAVKIKMYAANTYTPTTNNPVKLQFNADATTLKELRYNGKAVSPDNTWEYGETISVFYDGTYYQASNAQGGSNKKIDAYLYGDLRTLALGQTYEKGEAIKTTDKQLLRITKDIKDITLKEEIAIGDLKAYNNNTYKALKAVAYYDGTDTEGLYAIGKFSIVTITIDASSLSIEEDTDITVTIGSDTETITVPSEASETKAADIAALIATAFTSIDGWTLTDNLDGTLTLKCNSIGANTIVVSSNVGETGLQITSTTENGDNKLRQYNNGSWADVSIADWVADAGMWELLNLSGISVFTEQNTSIKTGTAENVSYDALQAILTGEDVQDAINEIGENLFETNSIALQLEASTKYYYTYSNGEIGTVQHNSFRKWLPVDISEYYAISSKFYLDSFHGAKTFFTDENDIKVGDFLINPDYKEHTYIVPKNAKKLYWSILYSSHTDISLKGIKRSSLKEKVAELEEGYKDEIDNSIVKKVSIYNPYGTTFYGYINMNGGVVTGGASSPYRYTSFIGVEKGDIICVHSNITQSPIAAIAAYDSNKQFVKGSAILADTSGNQDIIYRVPAGISYIRLSADITNNRWKAEKGISVKNVLSDGLHGVIEFTPDHSEGHFFIDLEGDFIRDNTNKWNVTVPFNVLEGDEVFFYTTSLHTSARLGAYSNGNLHKASEVVVGHSDIQSPSWYKYTVPQNVKWVRLSHMYSKDGDIKVYIRRKLEKMPKKSVSVLFIGNSITQDAVSYVPLLLRELAPELDFHFYVWYNGGYNLDQQLNSFNNDIPCEIFSRCSNGPSWKNFNNSVTMSSILSTYKFDIVQIQEYCHYKNTTELVNASVQTFNDIIEYIENHYNNPFKVATLYHKPLLDHDNQATAIQVFERTRAIVSKYLKETVTELLNPAGIAMYRAMATELDELGDQGHLSPDGRHGQEGLPCMIEAYVTAMWILNMLGIPMSAVNSKTVVDNTNYNEIYVPGPNLGNGVVIGTEDQVRLAQLVAVKALKEGEYIRNKELTEYTT